ncbi:MAG: hypothetical protein QXO51_06415 [Halobacteria archaeon]
MSFPFAALAMGLGSKHAFDADHLVAVGNILTGSNSFRRTATMVPFWVAGHMGTALAITLALWFAKEAYLAEFLTGMELAVAIMLLGLGAWRILAFLRKRYGHAHEHAHRLGAWVQKHVHPHVHFLRGRRDHLGLFGVGVIHGIASNDEILILATTALAVSTLEGLLLGVALFSIGLTLGMLLFGLGLTYPLLRLGGERTRDYAKLAAGVVCVGYAVWLFAGMEGVNAVELFVGGGT